VQFDECQTFLEVSVIFQLTFLKLIISIRPYLYFEIETIF